ncbi:CPCC family cysteine-rich protein [Streptomyces sioyaensis]|uniref:CPCC family cysteine-rich protein n=1 Tax=Streptomyces sioyaensis TaxID=67364 RepID=UPI0037B3A213
MGARRNDDARRTAGSPPGESANERQDVRGPQLLQAFAAGYSGNDIQEPSVGKVTCPCCGFLTLERREFYEICPVCGWEDDGQGDHNADECIGGPNRVSLTEARKNYAKFGAAEERDRLRVRSPLPEEFPN